LNGFAAQVDTAGYRDVQVLVREKRGGWIVEVRPLAANRFASASHPSQPWYRHFLHETT